MFFHFNKKINYTSLLGFALLHLTLQDLRFRYLTAKLRNISETSKFIFFFIS